jgi:uncharacterized membrane protein YfcA
VFALVGFLAQLVDGALGMAYGVVSTSVLLTFGVTPAFASASVHAAEVFTTAASAGSHVINKNINWKLFWRLAPAGVLGGVIGAYVLTTVDGAALRPYISVYLGTIGCYILYRAIFHPVPPREMPYTLASPLGVAGGFVDAAGGGGWGPVVTSTLVGSGGAPRYVIGTVNTAEFFITVAISATFLIALLSGHWADADGLTDHAVAVAGLIVGGLCAAPLAGFVVSRVPAKLLLYGVGVLIVLLASYQLWQAFGR